MYQMSGQRFAFSKQKHLFPESPWFPKIEAELNGTMSTKKSEPCFTASADIAFKLDVSAEREISIYFLPLSCHIYSFNPKQDGRKNKGQATWHLTHWPGTQSLGKENQNPVGPRWKHGLATWLTSFKPERSVPLMEELDVACNYEIGVELENSSESWLCRPDA